MDLDGQKCFGSQHLVVERFFGSHVSDRIDGSNQVGQVLFQRLIGPRACETRDDVLVEIDLADQENHLTSLVHHPVLVFALLIVS